MDAIANVMYYRLCSFHRRPSRWPPCLWPFPLIVLLRDLPMVDLQQPLRIVGDGFAGLRPKASPSDLERLTSRHGGLAV